MTALRIIEPGLHTSVQDRGRFGFQRYGIPVCGALDPEALELANALVGNDAGAAALEIRYLGPVFEVLADHVRIAIVGAEIAARIIRHDETLAFAANRSVSLRRGDRVIIGPLRASTTACLAIAGGVDVPSVLGSRSTFVRATMGGFKGRALKAGDNVPVQKDIPQGMPDLALSLPLEIDTATPVRVVLGPQADHFTDEAVATFLSATWTVSRNADRMGMRLDGPVLEHVQGHDITSDGIVGGAIQVPGTGQPIVLLADRQTSGGYPKIAAVISADLPRLGRAGPGATLGFEAVTSQEAVQSARARRAALDTMLSKIAPYRPTGEIDIDALYRENLISSPIEED